MALGITESKDRASAHTRTWLHKGRPVEDFLCEDSCVCGQCWRDGWGQAVWLWGVPPLLLCSPLNSLSLSLIHSVSCPLFLVVSASFPAAQPLYSLPSLSLASLSVHHTTDQSAVSMSQHPVLSHNTPACPCSLGQLPLPPCVTGHTLSLVSWHVEEDINDFFLYVHSNWWMPEFTTLAFPDLEHTLIILPTSL